VLYPGAEKSLARPGRKTSSEEGQGPARFKQQGGAGCLKVPPPPTNPQGKAPKEIHAILAEILACFLPGRANDLSAPLYQRQMCEPQQAVSKWRGKLS